MIVSEKGLSCPISALLINFNIVKEKDAAVLLNYSKTATLSILITVSLYVVYIISII